MRRSPSKGIHPMARRDTQGHILIPLPSLRSGRPFCLLLFSVPLLSAVLVARPAGAAPSSTLPTIKLTYRGGPLIQHVKVSTLFWGASWKSSSLAGYFNGFFSNLFADGRVMANLAQYSSGSYTIGNGSLAATDTDVQDPPSR